MRTFASALSACVAATLFVSVPATGSRAGDAVAAATESKDDIAAKVAGKDITRTNKKGQVYTTSYKKDGTTFSKSTKEDGSCCTTSPGNWWVNGEKVCETYQKWGNGGTWCHAP